MKVIPRIYQEMATTAALKGLRGFFRRALVVLATGLGKTLTTAFITKKLGAKRVLFLVHNNFILQHALEEFQLVFDENTKMAIYNGMSKKDVKSAHIVFATWQTMGGHLKQWERDYFDLIIVDEAQHTEADTYRPTVDHFTGPKLGITATPDRTDDTDIRDVFGKEVINITLEEAIARGWLPRIEYHVITDESLDEHELQKIAAEIRESKKHFTMAEVNRRLFIKKRDDEIARIINGYDEKAVVFCASIRHAERMKKPLKLAETFHSMKGKTNKDSWECNQAVLTALKNGTIRRVCAVNAFNEGVNVPSVGLVAFCRATSVLTVFRQQLGRGLRPGKEKLIVLDFVGNLERIQLVLEMMNKISNLHEQYTPRTEIEREGYSRHRFEVSGKGFEFTFSDKVADLMGVLKHCDRGEFYATWQEASQVAQKLGIKDVKQYKKLYTLDSRLHSNPAKFYKDFPGIQVFLGGKSRYQKYTSWQEAHRALQSLSIANVAEYRERYRLDPNLPADPVNFYRDFPGWLEYLGKNKYPSWQEASLAARKLRISSLKDYQKRYRLDKRLPSSPYEFYLDFPGLGEFLG
jgi:superfamily II DNA or RNA helicase